MLTNNKRFSEIEGTLLPSILRYIDIGADILLLIITLTLIFGILWSETGNAATNDGRAYEVDISNIKSGTLLYQLPDQVGHFAAPTLHTDIEVNVGANIADVVVTQEFYNPTQQFIEAIYAFPLSEDSAVYGMRLEVDGRIIEGTIQEKIEAVKTYEKAKKEGKRAGLMQQFRPNLFTTSIANIAAGETVHVVLQYQQLLRYQDFADQSYYELRIPTATTPRYVPNSAGASAQQVSTSQSFSEAEMEAMVENNSIDLADGKSQNSLNIFTNIVAGEVIRDIKSIGYPIIVSGPTDNRYQVNFAQIQNADRDYILRWYPEQSDQVQLSILNEKFGGENYYLLRLLPPLQGSSGGHALPREVSYIIDVSGSMAGASIEQAKKALAMAVSRLRAQDKFNIIKFSDDASALFHQPMDADQDHLTQALHYIAALETEGGTEIESALKLAFSMKSSEGYTGQIVFLTDGGVSNEQQLFSTIKQDLGERRLFTIGIGSAPNNFFMVKAAQFGRGVFTNISDISEVEEKMSALFRQLENPAMTDIEIRGENIANLDFWPRRVPDLYLGQPLTLAIKADQAKNSAISVKGKHGDIQWLSRIELSGALKGRGIARRWARTQIDALMDKLVSGVDEKQVRAEVLPLALKHQLVSRYTSFVAVDVTPVRNEDEDLRSLAYASSRPNSAMHLASTATSAPLQLALGIAILLLLILHSFVQQRSPGKSKPKAS